MNYFVIFGRNFLEVLFGLILFFEVDFFLKRSFFYGIFVGKLEKVVELKMFFIFDVCVVLIIFCFCVLKFVEKVRIILNCV